MNRVLKLDKDNLLQAKELWMKYRGVFQFMDQEGEYEKYRQFGVPKKQEMLWADEYQKELLAVITKEDIVSDSFVNIAFSLASYPNTDNIKSLLEHVKSKRYTVDTFTQLRMAEDVLLIAKSFSEEKVLDNVLAESFFSQGKIFKAIRAFLSGIKHSITPRIARKARQLGLDMLNTALKKPVTVAPSYYQTGYSKNDLAPEEILSRIQRRLKEINEA
jgi:hypothetical protein